MIAALILAALLPSEAADVRSLISAQRDMSRMERHIRLVLLPNPAHLQTLRRTVDATYYGDQAIRARLVKDHLSRHRNDFLDYWIYTVEDVKRRLSGDPVIQDVAGMVLWRLNSIDRDLTYESPYPHPALPSGRYPLFGPHGDYPAMMADHFSSLDYFRRAVWDDAVKTVQADDSGAFIEYTVWADLTYQALGLLADVDGLDLPRACRVQKAFDLLSLDQQNRYHGYQFTRFSDSWRFNGRSWHHATCLDVCGGCRP